MRKGESKIKYSNVKIKFEISGARGEIPILKEVEFFKESSLFFRFDKVDWYIPVQHF